MTHLKNTTGGGCLSRTNLRRQSSHKLRLTVFAAMLALVAAFAVPQAAKASVFDDLANGAAQLFSPIVQLFAGDSGAQTRAVEGTTTVDPDTTNVWSDIAASSTSTQNIGRIWTDKSVFDDDYEFSGSMGGQTVSKGESDFLVSLSALSSTSNLKTTTTTSQPLDIVLVLDDSGSMAYSIDSDMPNQVVYTAVSVDQVVESHGHTEHGWFGTSYIQDTRGGEYYVQNDRGGYDRITEVTETYSGGWLEGSYEEHVRWTVNGQTVDPETTQFYTRTEYDLSERRGALQYAVNNFIDQAAAMNAQIADENDKIRISIVVFDSNSSIENHLTVCEGANVGTLKNTVNSLEANGATNAGAGMTNANNELRTNSNREDTKQIVIFFTDGVPTTSDSFNTTVANNAVSQASQIKGSGGSVYSIGIFDGADPSQTEVGRNPNDTDRANVFMNAVSSNYPNATAWNNLGQRASGNPDFYKSADNAGSLNEVFQDIFDESTENAGSGSPIEEVTQEGELDPGTLTFTDDLGSYMEVTGGTMTVVYGDQKFTSTRKTTEGNVDTYHFEGTVTGNAVYGEANLADLTVTVTRGGDLATGDTVTVEIPASLIPMRNYDVDTNEKTMSVSDAYPIRLFYGVSVKQDAEAAVNAGAGDVYDAIKEDHLSEDGTIDFYSNAYAKNAPNGLTVATFKPSEGNKFYYYTQNTPLYVDEGCSIRATSSNIGSFDRVYYADTYWKTEGGTTSETTEGVPIARGGIEFGEIQYDQQGRAYMPADTQRTDRPHTLITEKEDFEGGNVTGTALNVLVPGWNDDGTVSQELGNNGKISYPAPGELEIKKGVDWGNASDETKQSQNNFEFTVNFNGDQTLSGEFSYDVYGSGEEPVRSGKVTDGGTVTLEDGQRAVIKGLPADTTFTVTEAEANQNGFTTTDIVTADSSNDTTDGIANGAIKGGSQQSVSFQNNYKADEPVKLSTKTDLKVKKNLTGRDWRETDEFSFQITQINNGAPTVQMDDPTKVKISQQTDQQTANFGDITFSESGQYRFRVEELSDADQGITPIAGIDYSGAIYRVTVDVADAGQGKLEITSVLIEQMTNDDGGQGSGEVQGDTMAFENRYVVGQASETLQGTKVYENETGSNPIDAGKFSFQLEALGGYETGTVPGDAQPDDYTIAADSDAMPKPAGMTGTTLETGNVGDVFQFPTIYFDGDDVGKTFEYRITELPHQYQGAAEPGMIYDEKTSYVVKIVVTEEQDPDSTEPKIVIMAEPSLQPSDITFTNKYEPTAAELTGDDAIHGTKTLEGRQMKEDETFYFQLSALNDNAKTVLSAPETVTVTDQNSMDFTFADMTFTKVGTYTFQVNEVADDNGTETTNANGMTFDTNIATVTVTVTDGNDSDDPADHGKLLASVSYSNDKHSNVTDHAQFTNVYKANMNYGAGGAGGIAVTKTMVDRTMDAGDYNFTLTGTGPDGKITETFENTAAAANGTVTMKQLQNLTFDEQDAEKTFTFTVDEADPTDENRLPGVEYDQSQYRVDITVHDNHDGNMYTETTVTKIKNADGTEANEIVVVKLNSSTAQGQVPTFGFKNVYKPTEASLDGDTALKVIKKVTGASSPDGVNYTFTLTAQDTAEGLIDNIGGLTDGKLTVSTSGIISADGEQTVSFGKLTFSKPGTYTFKVQENQPVADDGWTFDDADGNGVTDEHTVTVEVSDLNENNEYDGALHIKSVTPEDPTLITNSYKADPVIVGGDGAQQKITVQKSVTGADSDAEFKFKIEPVIDDEHTQQWWQDRVKATEGFSPELTISGVTQEQAVTNSFAGIEFNAVGEYTFNVTEVGAADFNAGTDRKGWTYDDHIAHVTVKVTDDNNDGQLDAEVIYDNSDATTDADKTAQAAAFTNKYSAGETSLYGRANLKVDKILEGRSWLDTDAFSFVLAADNDNPTGATLPERTELTITGITVGHTASFGDITFTKPGTFVFTVTEQPSNITGITDDADSVRTIVVNVVDNQDGTMTATVDSGKSDNLVFTNTFKTTGVTLSGDSAIKVQKTLDGRAWAEGETFEFTLAAKTDGAPMPENSKFTIDKPTTGNVNTVAFGDMTFTQPGTYVYTISETPGEDATISYDDHTAEVTVAVFQGGNGHDANELWAQVSYNNGTAKNEADKTVTGAAAFTNTQGLESKVELTGTKEITGRDFIEGDTFTFTVTGEKGAPKPDGVDENGSVTINPTEGSKATIDFGAITFTEAGEYVYHVAEAEGTIDGMTYDTARRDVIITVTDDGLGNLSAQITSGADQLAWTNAWAFQGAKFVELNGTKTMSGEKLENGQFTFLVKPRDNAPMGDTLPANFNGNATQNEDGTWTAPVSLLSNIAFDEAGDYVYVISEVNDGQPGVTYDDTQYRVTLSVANDGTVSQKIEQSKNGTDWTDATAVAFANSYATDDEATLEGAVNLTGTKTLQGRDWLDDDSFTFLLAQVEGSEDAVRMPADTAVVVQGNYSDGAAVPFAFGDIVFTEAGDYAFTISEQQPGSDGFVGNTDGMTYDDHVVTISVNVADNGEGKLEATVTGVDGNNNWTNVYKAGGEDKPGILNGAENLVVTKVIEGREWLDTDSFTFTLVADESNPDGVTMPAETTVTIDANSENHQAAFGDITFANPGNYKFTVTETAGNIEGMTYDTTPHVVEVSVVDNEDGTLSVSVVSPIVAKDLTFTNTYERTDGGQTPEGSIAIEKVLKNRAWDESDTFSFELTPLRGTSDDGAIIRPENMPMPRNASVTMTKDNVDGSGIAHAFFGGIQFDEAGTYVYKVHEVNGGQIIDGVSYDSHEATVTIIVTDNLKGGLDVKVGVADGTFTNVYDAEETSASFTGIKLLVGRDFRQGDEFTFQVTSVNGAPLPGNVDGSGKITIRPSSGGSANIDFGSIKIDHAGTYEYTIDEIEGSIPGIKYDTHTETVIFDVTDNGEGGYIVSYQGEPVWENEYEAEFVVIGDNEADLQVTKSVTGAGALSEFEFRLQLTTNNADGVQGLKDGNSITKATTGLTGTQGNETVDFGDLTFTKPGDYVFTVTETTTTTTEGWTYDNAPKTIMVHVTDPGDGQLVATVEGNNPIVANKYDEPYIPPTPTPDETDPSKPDLDVDKTLAGRDMVAGEFNFTITATGDNADHVSPKTLTGTNDASGNVSFSGDGFTFDEAGEYTFTVSEVLPQDDDPETPGVQHNGVTYDETTYTITAKVTKGAGNKFVATWDLGSAAGGVTFANTYEPDETASVSLGATKVLNGRDLVAGEFTFELVDGQGNVVATATNAADGSVIFSSIEFTEAGTYTYLIREVAGSLANVTYDTATHTATVTVTDNGDGTLTATVLYDGSGTLPVFTNTYKVPEEPGEPDKPGKPTEPTKPSKPEEPQKPATPDTGDHTNAAAPVALALSGVALVAGAYVLRVRRNR